MSVHGEFQRVLAELVGDLRATQHATCQRSADALETLATSARDDLDAAARSALEICAGPAPAELSAGQRERIEARAGHLAAICRALVG